MKLADRLRTHAANLNNGIPFNSEMARDFEQAASTLTCQLDAINQTRLAFVGMVSTKSAIDKVDGLPHYE